MGWAERNNPNSEWNKKRAGNIAFSSQSTQKTNFKVPTPVRDEPMVVELSSKTIFSFFKDFLWSPFKHRRSPAPTS